MTGNISKFYLRTEIINIIRFLFYSKLPIVEMKVVVKASSENLNRMHVFPTPESPISNNLKSKSYVFFAISFLRNYLFL